MATCGTPQELAAVSDLRARLTRRQESLALLRRRIEAARSGEHRNGRPLSSVGDISRRFMNAAAESESRGMSSRPVITGGDGVGSLLSKWNKGFEMKEAEKERVTVRGDVRGASNKFSKANSSLSADVRAAKRDASRQPSDGMISVEDDDVPSWAINQSKRVIQKENAKALTGNVNVDRTKGSVMNQSGEIDVSGFREKPKGGNVGGAIAMWGQKAEDQEAKEREGAIRLQTMRSLRNDFENRQSRESAEPEPVEEQPVAAEVEQDPNPTDFVFEDSDDEEDEPDDVRLLVDYLERKCQRVQMKIDAAEVEMEKIDRLSQ